MTFFNDYRGPFDNAIAEMQQLSRSSVDIGFLQGSVTRSQTKGNRRKIPGQSMAQIAIWNEYGTRNIPPRPFMRSSFDRGFRRITRVVNQEIYQALSGRRSVRQSLNVLGVFVQQLIQRRIREIYIPPNAASTIRIKKSSKPLIDFGQMIQSVSFRINQ